MADNIVPPPLPQTPPPLPHRNSKKRPPASDELDEKYYQEAMDYLDEYDNKTQPPEYYFSMEKDILFTDKAEADLVSSNPDAILQRIPQTADDFSLRGKARAYKGEFDLAIADYKKALEIENNKIDILANYALACFSKGDYAEAIKRADELININPDFIYGYIVRAYTLLAKQEHDKAIDEWTKIIQKESKSAYWYLWRGSSYWYIKNFPKSIEDFNKAIELKSDFADAIYFRGQAYIESSALAQDKKVRLDYLKKSAADFKEAARLVRENANFVKTLEQANQLLVNFK